MLGALYGAALADSSGTAEFPVLQQGNAEVLSVWSLIVLLCSETWGFSLLVTNGCQGWEPGRDEFRVIYSLINAVILPVLLV